MVTTLELEKVKKLVEQRRKDTSRDVRAEMQSEGILGQTGTVSRNYGGKDRPLEKARGKPVVRSFGETGRNRASPRP